MAGITQKSCVALFPLWGRTNVNQQKQTKKFTVLIRSHVSMMATVTIAKKVHYC